MNQHTPGPWQLVQRDSNRYVEDAEGQTVCAIPDGFFLTEAEAPDANARLIAVAPELLNALQAIVAAPYGVANGDLERAVAAIAKATGETA